MKIMTILDVPYLRYSRYILFLRRRPILRCRRLNPESLGTNKL